MSGQFRVGTSGWSYKHWIEVFYPKAVKSRDWLAYYARHFDTVEINNTFYHLPSESAVRGWYEQTPDSFVFGMKMSRFITHLKKLRNVEEGLDNFVARIRHLKEKTGPVLIQLPPNFLFHAELLEAFIDQVRHRLPGVPLAIEPRNPSWFTSEAITLYRRLDLALCLADSTNNFPDLELRTAGFVYLRFHGRDGLYMGDYTYEQLRPFARKITQWLAEGVDVYAYFNNDIGGYAVKNALMLRELVQQS